MSKVTSVRRCYHCGKVLQDQDPSKEGYIQSEAFNKRSGNEILLCLECYDKLRYNEAPASAEVNEDYLKMLRDAKKEGALIVYLVDLLSFECSFVKEILDIIDGLPLVIIGTKRDLMPKQADSDYLREYVAHRFRVEGFKQIKNDDVVLLDWTSSADVSSAVCVLEKKRKGKSAYVIGAKGVGKSAFITSFLRQYRNTSNRGVGILNYKETSLEVWQIPLSDDASLYDTPGTGVDNSFIGLPDHPKEINVFEQLVERKVDVSENGGLFIGLLSKIEPIHINGKKRITMHCYFPKKVELKAITPKSDMNALFIKYIQKKALKPRYEKLEKGSDFDVFDFELEANGPRDIGIAGLGWISFKGSVGDVYRVTVPKNIGVYASRAKINKE